MSSAAGPHRLSGSCRGRYDTDLRASVPGGAQRVNERTSFYRLGEYILSDLYMDWLRSRRHLLFNSRLNTGHFVTEANISCAHRCDIPIRLFLYPIVYPVHRTLPLSISHRVYWETYPNAKCDIFIQHLYTYTVINRTGHQSPILSKLGNLYLLTSCPKFDVDKGTHILYKLVESM